MIELLSPISNLLCVPVVPPERKGSRRELLRQYELDRHRRCISRHCAEGQVCGQATIRLRVSCSCSSGITPTFHCHDHGHFRQRHLGPYCRFAQLRNSGSIIETGLLARHWSGVTSKGTGCALKRDALMISKLYLKYTEGRDLRAEGRIRRLLNNKSITQV